MPAREELTQVERDKIEIDPDFDFREIANKPFDELTSNELGMFKWSGVYHQLQTGFFMIRLRMPGGILNADQLQRAGELANEFGQGRICITTRQTLQFHWIRQQDIHKIIEEMAKTGVSTRNACGDVTRNVITCPLAGVCPHEEGDTLDMLDTVADDPALLNEYRNLPRKHKISVAGCGRACGQTLMNCQGWHPVNRDGKTGWRFHAGGGLGARPYMGKRIFEWVPEELVIHVVRATAEAFNRHGNRRKRAWARLKIVVDRMGAQGFADVVLGILKEWQIDGTDRIEVADREPEIGESFLDGQAVIKQKQDGFSTVRVMIPRGELTGDQLIQIADWARAFGDGSIIFTNRQNLQFRFVTDAKVDALVERLQEVSGWQLDGHERVPDAVACVGTTMCNLAVADTPNAYNAIMNELTADRDWWDQIGSLRINMNGCPNSCAQHWISDIGLRGARKREGHGSVEGFSIYTGGTLAGAGHIAEYVCDAYSDDIVPTIRQILEFYLDEREDGEAFGDFARRLSGDGIRERLERIQAETDYDNLRDLDLKSVFDMAVSAPHKRTSIKK